MIVRMVVSVFGSVQGLVHLLGSNAQLIVRRKRFWRRKGSIRGRAFGLRRVQKRTEWLMIPVLQSPQIRNGGENILDALMVLWVLLLRAPDLIIVVLGRIQLCDRIKKISAKASPRRGR